MDRVFVVPGRAIDDVVHQIRVRMHIRSINLRILLNGAILLIVLSHLCHPAMAFQHSDSRVTRPSYITLESLVDRFRPLLVFAPGGESAELVEQVRLLTAGSKVLRERQVFFVPVIAGSDRRLSEQDVEVGYLRPEGVAAVRTRFRVGEGEFTVVLIGKDGGEKFRTGSPVTIEKLKAVIDAMPMRQQEERDGHAK